MKQPAPLISIIVPVYNMEQYLETCIDSLIRQTYSNLEIILIDDGAKDRSGQICDEYAAKDPRIVVLHKENQGVAAARNDGIAMAHGDYITFVDSDDWVDLRLCEIFANALTTYSVSSVMCSYVREYPDRALPKVLGDDGIVWTGKAVQRRLCGLLGEELRHPDNLDSYNMMCAKLYPAEAAKKHSVMNLRSIGSSEDLLYNLSIFSDIESMVMLDQPLYHYRKAVPQSITSTYKPDLEQKWENLYGKIDTIIRENGFDETYRQAFSNRIALNMLGVGLNCVWDNGGFREKYQRVKRATAREVRAEALKALPLRYMPLHWKLFYFSARHKLNLILYLLLVAVKKLKGKV